MNIVSVQFISRSSELFH